MPFKTRLCQTYFGRPLRVFLATGQFLAAAHFFVTYFYSWGSACGPSMLPGWEVWGQGAITSHLHRRGKDVRVGDLVKFKIPITQGDAIKRVAGLPGDYVLVHSPESGRDEMIQIPKGHCWVLGDNLPASRDSRLYGPLPMALIDGKVIYQTGSWPWQWSQIKKIRNPLDEE
ncbi:LexA/Signal peptidase [Cryphonectria parasitica EP155]|uniref:LexA/Signal peptidase n=1 Tax=Cryphonectria parasitica (strain ATCC 38755 / EP155) TaxID=660469 RepID=A0A9P4YCE8_CRYP1|nr:LexA/Signal peptidase [Cryphonectria parasitica EP155]KAF3770964.1 LexA/Signal peptidase [Cryphonectria parasitica EP155]